MEAKFIVVKDGARDRNRTGTPVIHEAADFKSDVSTYFTTRACNNIVRTAIVLTAILATAVAITAVVATAIVKQKTPSTVR